MHIPFVRARIREEVFKRDGRKCWLCNSENDNLHIAHQINADDQFPLYHINSTIPSSIFETSHPDNLFPLCDTCHKGYDAGWSDWLIVPDKETLQKYIDHEKNDFEQRERYLLSQKSRSSSSLSVPPRSLPLLNRNKILYHPLLLNEQAAKKYVRQDTHWPKHWLGEPTLIIHRSMYRSIFLDTAITTTSGRGVRPLRLASGAMWQIGVPDIFTTLVTELMMLWRRQPGIRRGI